MPTSSPARWPQTRHDGFEASAALGADGLTFLDQADTCDAARAARVMAATRLATEALMHGPATLGAEALMLRWTDGVCVVHPPAGRAVLGRAGYNLGAALLALRGTPRAPFESGPLALRDDAACTECPPFEHDALVALWQIAGVIARTEIPRLMVIEANGTEITTLIGRGAILGLGVDAAADVIIDAVQTAIAAGTGPRLRLAPAAPVQDGVQTLSALGFVHRAGAGQSLAGADPDAPWVFSTEGWPLRWPMGADLGRIAWAAQRTGAFYTAARELRQDGGEVRAALLRTGQVLGLAAAVRASGVRELWLDE